MALTILSTTAVTQHGQQELLNQRGMGQTQQEECSTRRRRDKKTAAKQYDTHTHRDQQEHNKHCSAKAYGRLPPLVSNSCSISVLFLLPPEQETCTQHPLSLCPSVLSLSVCLSPRSLLVFLKSTYGHRPVGSQTRKKADTKRQSEPIPRAAAGEGEGGGRRSSTDLYPPEILSVSINPLR